MFWYVFFCVPWLFMYLSKSLSMQMGLFLIKKLVVLSNFIPCECDCLNDNLNWYINSYCFLCKYLYLQVIYVYFCAFMCVLGFVCIFMFVSVWVCICLSVSFVYMVMSMCISAGICALCVLYLLERENKWKEEKNDKKERTRNTWKLA